MGKTIHSHRFLNKNTKKVEQDYNRGQWPWKIRIFCLCRVCSVMDYCLFVHSYNKIDWMAPNIPGFHAWSRHFPYSRWFSSHPLTLSLSLYLSLSFSLEQMISAWFEIKATCLIVVDSRLKSQFMSFVVVFLFVAL